MLLFWNFNINMWESNAITNKTSQYFTFMQYFTVYQ